jgi:hypothetical protein
VIKLPKKEYTPKQDVQLGKEAASDVRKQYPIIEDQHIAKYLTQIGNRLVAAAPTELKQSVYECSFTPVNLKDINAFALPGGPMFVQRGMFDAAAEEAAVAGVVAHELSGVLLRHGTANASKAQNPWLQLGQIAGAVGGAVVGGELGGYIAEGIQFGLGTLLLRYSRDYEKQADLLGAQIMARAGYDPRALAHAPSRSASIRLNKTATWFQLALFWSTNLRSPAGDLLLLGELRLASQPTSPRPWVSHSSSASFGRPTSGSAGSSPFASLQRDKPREDYRRLVRELRDEGELSAHRLDIVPKRREQQVAALLEPGHAVLSDAEDLGHPSLRQLVSVAKLLQRALLCNDGGRARRNLPPALRTQSLAKPGDVVHDYRFLLVERLLAILVERLELRHELAMEISLPCHD